MESTLAVQGALQAGPVTKLQASSASAFDCSVLRSAHCGVTGQRRARNRASQLSSSLFLGSANAAMFKSLGAKRLPSPIRRQSQVVPVVAKVLENTVTLEDKVKAEAGTLAEVVRFCFV